MARDIIHTRKVGVGQQAEKVPWALRAVGANVWLPTARGSRVSLYAPRLDLRKIVFDELYGRGSCSYTGYAIRLINKTKYGGLRCYT